MSQIIQKGTKQSKLVPNPPIWSQSVPRVLNYPKWSQKSFHNLIVSHRKILKFPTENNPLEIGPIPYCWSGQIDPLL